MKEWGGLDWGGDREASTLAKFFPQNLMASSLVTDPSLSISIF